MINEVQLYQGMSLLAGMAVALMLLIPDLADWAGTWLHAHAIAMTRFYRVLAEALRQYVKAHREVMEAEQR